jgi:hypothetical protein
VPRAASVLKGSGIPFVEGRGRLVVPAHAAFNTTLLFSE